MNKKKNIKIYIIFAIFMIVSMLGGYFAGAMAKNMQSGIDTIDYNKVANAIYIPSCIFRSSGKLIPLKTVSSFPPVR